MSSSIPEPNDSTLHIQSQDSSPGGPATSQTNPEIACDAPAPLVGEHTRADEAHLLELDPAWLYQWPPQQQKDLFFQRILPLLVLRIHPDVSNIDNFLMPIKEQTEKWLLPFREPKFDVAAAVKKYQRNQLGALTSLYQYLILEKAKVMLEKLWRICPEFYLLGLAYSCSDTRGGHDTTTRNLHEPASLDPDQLKELGNICRQHEIAMFRRLCDDWEGIERSSVDGEDTHPIDCVNCYQESAAEWFRKMIRANTPEYFRMAQQFRRQHFPNYLEDISAKKKIVRIGQIRILGDEPGPEQAWQGESIQDQIWKCYNEGPSIPTWGGHNGEAASTWPVISLNVRNFCIQAGRICPTFDPLENLQALRHQFGSQMIHNSELVRRNEELEAENRKKLRIISALSCRNILENLPEPVLSGTGRPNHTASWKAFWDKAWKIAIKDKTSPFAPVNDLYKENLGLPDRCASSLYQTLSAQIHNYRANLTFLELDNAELNKSEKMVLQILHPLRENINIDGTVNWEKERMRFLGAKAQPNERSKADKVVRPSGDLMMDDTLSEEIHFGRIFDNDDVRSTSVGEQSSPGTSQRIRRGARLWMLCRKILSKRRLEKNHKG